MTQFWCLNKFSKQIKSTQSQFISGNHCEPGTSWCESRNSGIIRILRVCFRILQAWFCHQGPTNVLNPSLSLTSPYHSLSPVSSLSLTLSLFPPKPWGSNPLSIWSQGQGSLQSAWRTFYSTCSSLGCCGFQVPCERKDSSKVFKLGFGTSILLGGFNRFPLVKHIYMHP